MSNGNGSSTDGQWGRIDVQQRAAGRTERRQLEVIAEEPLAVRVDGKPYAVVMRTPADDLAHAAGFAFTEGLVDSMDDIASLGACRQAGVNVVTITLSPERRKQVADVLDNRRGYVSQTSCGICGKSLVEELQQQLPPVRKAFSLSAAQAEALLESIGHLQPLRRKTAAAHCAVLFDRRLERLASAEDVGRHNALDKAIGALFVARRLEQAAVAVLSSRISYELVQKAARAAVPVLLGISRPTGLAVTLADRLGMTLACLARPSGLLVCTHPQRIL